MGKVPCGPCAQPELGLHALEPQQAWVQLLAVGRKMVQAVEMPLCGGGDTSSAVSNNAKLAWLLLRPHCSPSPQFHAPFLFSYLALPVFKSCSIISWLRCRIWSIWGPSFSSAPSAGAQAMSGNFECVMDTVSTHVCMLTTFARCGWVWSIFTEKYRENGADFFWMVRK